MKVFLPWILLVLGVLAQAQTPAASTPAMSVAQQNADQARSLLEKMIQALGGQAYLNIQDIEQQGRTYSFYHGRPSSYGIQFWEFWKYPDKDRFELTKKRDVVEIFNGDKGYEITYKGTRAQDPKDLTSFLRRRLYSLPWVVRKWMNDPGTALFYDGAAVAAEKPAEQVSLINDKNQSVTIYLDSTTYLPIKKSFTWRDPVDRQRDTEDEVYDNYRPVQGIMTPFSVTRFYNGDISNQRFLNSVAYNQGVADSKFEARISYDGNQPAPRK